MEKYLLGSKNPQSRCYKLGNCSIQCLSLTPFVTIYCPTYANIRSPDGRDSTASLQDLAPYSGLPEKSYNTNKNRINNLMII